MWTVTASLGPVVVAAAWWFGISALLVLVAAVLGACAAEATFGKGRTLRDGSAALTGLLLGLTLPPGLPAWMAFVGGAVAVGMGKSVFGGLGQNVFNPALLGRAFLQAAFPVAVTTWGRHGHDFWTLAGDTFALPFATPHPLDGTTAATPLGSWKFEGRSTGALDLLVGNTGGSLGETCDLLILVGGAWLAFLRVLAWRVPVAILATVAALSAVLSALGPVTVAGRSYACPEPLFMLFSGGLTLGAVYMATDPVTSPITPRGAVVFGVLIGVLVVLIRVFGGLPEGVMYSVLIANACLPLIDRVTQPRVFGTATAEAKGATP
jgi:electron transport complex protein RnfD